MSWIYLAEQESSQERSTKPWLGTALKPGQSPTVSENGALKGFFSAGRCEARSTLPPYARMSANARRQAFNVRSDLWASTCWGGASPARTSASRELARVWRKGNEAAFSSRSCVWLGSLDRASFTWRTCQLSLLEADSESLRSLPPLGMTADGLLYRLPTSVRPTSGSAGGSWPTPLKSDSDKLSGPHYGKNDTLTSAAKAWHTPRASESGAGESSESFVKRNGDRGMDCFSGLTAQATKGWATPKTQNANGAGFDDLQTQALGWAWPTPTARDYRGANTPEATERRKAEGHHQQLNDWAAYSSGHLTPATGKAGLGSWPLLLSYARRLRSHLGSRPPGRERHSRSMRLNPLFEEWLLGSPIGMTEYEPAVTAWILSAQRKPIKSCSVECDDGAA